MSLTIVKQPLVFESVAKGIAALLLFQLGCGRSEPPKIVRVAYVSNQQELLHKAAVQFAERVRETSKGRMKVRLYPGGQLGSERELVEGLRLGTNDICISGLAAVGWYMPEYGVLEAPFVWRDYGHMQRVWDGPIGKEIRDEMKQRSGLDIVQTWYRGPRYLTTTSRRIETPADLNGLKLRVPELQVYVKSWQAFGANTTPIPFSDMFMALRLGVVDGQENPLATIYGNRLQEVQKYIMNTKHLLGFYVVLISDRLGSRFTAVERETIFRALEEATTWHNQKLLQSEEEYRDLLQSDGMEFVDVDRMAFQRLALERIPRVFAKDWKDGLFQSILQTP